MLNLFFSAATHKYYTLNKMFRKVSSLLIACDLKQSVSVRPNTDLLLRIKGLQNINYFNLYCCILINVHQPVFWSFIMTNSH